jgi:hypothetical protein
MKEDMQQQARQVIALIKGYTIGGFNEAVLEKMRTVRHAHLRMARLSLRQPAAPVSLIRMSRASIRTTLK